MKKNVLFAVIVVLCCASSAFAAVASYTITAGATIGGKITPAGIAKAAQASTKIYKITPATGYGIADVIVDNAAVGPITSYTFTNITANHTISVVFYSKSYTASENIL